MCVMKRTHMICFVALIVAVLFTLSAALNDPWGIDARSVRSYRLNHISAFIVVSMLAFGAFGWRPIRIVLALLAFGIGIEIVQSMTGRDAQFLDVVADIFGIFLGMLTSLIVRRKNIWLNHS